MLVVHHLGKSQSERIVWLCEELAIPYELKRYERDPTTMAAPPEVKALHPLGAAPVVTDGDVVIAESGAIVEYILGRYGNGRLTAAPAAANYPDYVYWLHFVNGSLQSGFSVNGLLRLSGLADDNMISGAMASRLKRAIGTVEARLGQVPFLAGSELTAADIMMMFTLTTMRYFVPFDLASYPNILAYLARIAERPAYRTAMQKGDPGMALLLS